VPSIPASPPTPPPGTDLVPVRATLPVPLARTRAVAGSTARRTATATVTAGRVTGRAIGVPVARTGWRFLAGHDLIGRDRRRTDATTWRRSSQFATRTRGQTVPWSHLRGVERAGVRWVCATAGWLVADHLAALPTLAVTGALTATMTAHGAVQGVRAVRGRRHRRSLVRPLAAALAPILDVDPVDAEQAITLPPGYHAITDGTVGHIAIPDHWQANADQKRAVEHLVSSRLPVDVDYAWRMSRHPFQVTLKASPKPPDLVRFAEMTGDMSRCAPGEIILGVDRHATLYRGDWNSDDPHWGASCGSGRGKSSWLQLIAAQILHQDPRATLTGIDPKMASFAPLIGIPGVIIHNDPRHVESMWSGIERVKDEMMRRLTTLEQNPDATFPFNLLMVDEVNMFSAMTLAVWRATKQKGDPAVPPVWMDLASILWMGRVVRCHVVMVGQRLDSPATGGIGLRDSLGLRALSGFTPQQWMMLVGQTPVLRSQKGRGRWVYSDGSTTTWVQNIYGTPAEIRDWALAGRRLADAVPTDATPDRRTGPESAVTVSHVPDAPTARPAETGLAGTGTEVMAGTQWVVGLDAGARYLDMKTEAFRKRRQRAGGLIPGEVRQGGQPAWSTDDLDAWRASWPRIVSA
jgi:hypothetical protein